MPPFSLRASVHPQQRREREQLEVEAAVESAQGKDDLGGDGF